MCKAPRVAAGCQAFVEHVKQLSNKAKKTVTSSAKLIPNLEDRGQYIYLLLQTD